MKAGGICGSKAKCQSSSSRSPKRYTKSDNVLEKKEVKFASLPTYLSSMPKITKINESTFNTGKFINQNGRKFPILFNIDYREGVLDIDIPVPKEYKKTLLTKKINQFGRIIISVNETDRLYLNLFYLYPQVYSKIATPYEKEAFKGIGKLILCFAINELKFDISDKIIGLSAEGGGLMTENEIGTYPYGIDKVTKYLEKYYKDDPDIMYYIDKDSPVMNRSKILYRAFAMIEAQRNLIKYYGKYGFKIVTYDENDKKTVLELTAENINKNIHLGIRGETKGYVATKMEAPVKDILAFCKK